MSLAASIFGDRQTTGGGLFDTSADLPKLAKKEYGQNREKKIGDDASADTGSDGSDNSDSESDGGSQSDSNSSDGSNNSDSDDEKNTSTSMESKSSNDKESKKKEKKKDTTKRKEEKFERSDSKSSGEAAGPNEPARNTDNDVSTDKDSRTIFVGNLPASATRRDLEKLFKQCGKISSTRLRSVAGIEGVKLPPERAGNQNLVRKVCVNTGRLGGAEQSARKTAQGYVVFQEMESVEKALKLNNKPIKGDDGTRLRIRVDRSQPTIDSARSVFVGNLPYAADESSLRQHFVTGCEMADGDVENVRIVRDAETQKCKGFGYVLLSDRSLVATALSWMQGTEYLRRPIRVMVCGKRFKGKKGRHREEAAKEKTGAARRFEGKQSTGKEAGGGSGKKRKLSENTSSPGGPFVSASKLAIGKLGGKKRRARGGPSTGGGGGEGSGRKSGVSRRSAAKAKDKKRVKKIEKRIKKGMGKAK